MNYYELTFTYTSPVETSIINDVLAAELGEIGFESFAENENGLQGYISDQLYNVKGLQDKLAEFPLENVDIHFTETLVESKDWNEEWEKHISRKPWQQKPERKATAIWSFPAMSFPAKTRSRQKNG